MAKRCTWAGIFHIADIHLLLYIGYIPHIESS